MQYFKALQLLLISFSFSACNYGFGFDDYYPLSGPFDFAPRPQVWGGGDGSFATPYWMKVILPDDTGFFLLRYQEFKQHDTWTNNNGDEVDHCDPTARVWFSESECAKGEKGHSITTVGLEKEHYGGRDRTYQLTVTEDKNDGLGWRLSAKDVNLDHSAIKCWTVAGQDDIFREIFRRVSEELELERDVRRVKGHATWQSSRSQLPVDVRVSEELTFGFEQRISGSWDFSLDHKSDFFSFLHTAHGNFVFSELLGGYVGDTSLNMPNQVDDPTFPRNTSLSWIYDAHDVSALNAHIASFPLPLPFSFIPWTQAELFTTFRDYWRFL